MNVQDIRQMKVLYIMDKTMGKSRLSLYNELALKVDNDMNTRNYPVMLLIKGFTSSESDKYGRMFRMMRDGHITIDPSTQTQDVEAKRQSYELLVW